MGCPRYVRFPLIATEDRTSRDVSNVPEGDIAAALARCQPGDGRHTQSRDVSDLANSEIDGQLFLTRIYDKSEDCRFAEDIPKLFWRIA
jgi:hypothetical protein